ncbi:hypothetical protein ACW185_08760 [Limosilactobacillus fermentum]
MMIKSKVLTSTVMLMAVLGLAGARQRQHERALIIKFQGIECQGG